MNPIVFAMAGGAVGGAVGALLGLGLTRLLRRSRRAPLAAIVAAVAALGGAQIGARMTAPSISDQLVAASPVFATLKHHYPDTFNTMVAQLSSAPPHADKVQLVNLARPSLLALIQSQMPKFSPHNTDQLFRTEVQEAEAMEKVSPDNCLNLMNSRPLTVTAADTVSGALLRQDMDLENRALIQAAEAPSPLAQPLPPAQIVALTRAALSTIPAADRTAALWVVRANGVASNAHDADLSCRLYIAIMHEALKTPGTVVRLAVVK